MIVTLVKLSEIIDQLSLKTMSLSFLCNRVARQHHRAELFPKACFAMSAKKLRMKERAERHSIKMKALDPSNMPQFHDLLKKLYIRSHPDLLRSSSIEKVATHFFLCLFILKKYDAD